MITILLWPDGHATHNGLDYSSLQELIDVLQPDDYVLCEVTDNATAEKAKE